MNLLKIIKQNTDRAFQAFLAVGDEPPEVLASLEMEDALIEKNAGIMIYRPTAENIENFVSRYLRSEIRAQNEKIYKNLSISIQSIYSNDLDPSLVKDASGLASLVVGGKEIELPFLISDGEFIPFDVIQVGNERVPYSRENLGKIMRGLEQAEQEKPEKGIEEFKPYLGLTAPVNPTSSVGFMGDVLRIQQQHAQRGGQAGSYYVTAADEFDGLLEKLSVMQPATENDWQALEQKLLGLAVEGQRQLFEKHAAELAAFEEDKLASVSTAIDRTPWKNANDCSHGQVIVFPEIRDKEMSLTRGLVLAKFESVKQFGAPANNKLVLSEDGRVQILNPGDRFLCAIPPKGEVLSIPTAGLETLEQGDAFLAFNGDQAIYPQRISSIRKRLVGALDHRYDSDFNRGSAANPLGVSTVRVYHLDHPIRETANLFGVSGFYNHRDDNLQTRLVGLDGTRFVEMAYDDFLLQMAKQLGMEDNLSLLTSVLSREDTVSYDRRALPGPGFSPIAQGLVVAVDDKTPVIKIKPQQILFASSLNDLKDFERRATNPDSDFAKSASAGEYLEINTADKEARTFNFTIRFIDRSTKNFRLVTRRLKGVNYERGREILKALSLPLSRVAELMLKADHDGYARAELPENATPDFLQGQALKGKATELVKRMRMAIFNPAFTDQMSSEVLGRTMDSGLGPAPNQVKKQLVRALKAKQAEAAALSACFEKQAIDKESDALRKVAVLMAVTAHLDDKVAGYFAGGDEFFQLKGVAKEILEHRDYLEKTAYDLVALKANQVAARAEEVPMSRLGRAVQTLDHLYKLAFYIAQ